jgi:hypothetical protein
LGGEKNPQPPEEIARWSNYLNDGWKNRNDGDDAEECPSDSHIRETDNRIGGCQRDGDFKLYHYPKSREYWNTHDGA